MKSNYINGIDFANRDCVSLQSRVHNFEFKEHIEYEGSLPDIPELDKTHTGKPHRIYVKVSDEYFMSQNIAYVKDDICYIRIQTEHVRIQGGLTRDECVMTEIDNGTATRIIFDNFTIAAMFDNIVNIHNKECYIYNALDDKYYECSNLKIRFLHPGSIVDYISSKLNKSKIGLAKELFYKKLNSLSDRRLMDVYDYVHNNESLGFQFRYNFLFKLEIHSSYRDRVVIQFLLHRAYNNSGNSVKIFAEKIVVQPNINKKLKAFYEERKKAISIKRKNIKSFEIKTDPFDRRSNDRIGFGPLVGTMSEITSLRRSLNQAYSSYLVSREFHDFVMENTGGQAIEASDWDRVMEFLDAHNDLMNIENL